MQQSQIDLLRELDQAHTIASRALKKLQDAELNEIQDEVLDEAVMASYDLGKSITKLYQGILS